MKYLKLAEIYEKLSSTTKRLEKIEILSEFLKTIKNEDSEILYLLQGEIYPEYDERKIGISDQLVIKALSKSTGISKEKITKEWKKIGDLGEVSKKLISQKKQTTLFSTSILTTTKILENLRKLPTLEGKGTVTKKLSLIVELYANSTPLESLYLTRTLLGDLRIGVQESTIKYSILKAFFNNNKNYEENLQRAIDRSNDLEEVFKIAKTKNPKELNKIKLQVGKPIKAMLAEKAKNIEDAFEHLGKPLAIEYKYDGFRLLIHKKENQIILFTRRLENVTKQFPEVEKYVKDFIKGNSFIIDAEAVGYNKKTKKYTDFQEISQRIRRKYKIEDLQNKLPVEITTFDILYYNGKSMLDTPFEERAKFLRSIVKDTPYKLITSKFKITSSKKEIEEFYKKALRDRQEGIMLKKLDAKYKPGRRVGQMLKLKPESNDLDLVITGGEWGNGKRSGWLSSLNLSCKGEEGYLEIGKVGTGIAEKETIDNKITFENLTNLLKPLITKEKGKEVIIKPKIIVTVTYQDIQKSPNYKSNWALRFPRILALREDKPLSEIATLEEIETAFKNSKHQNYRYG